MIEMVFTLYIPNHFKGNAPQANTKVAKIGTKMDEYVFIT